MPLQISTYFQQALQVDRVNTGNDRYLMASFINPQAACMYNYWSEYHSISRFQDFLEHSPSMYL